MRNNQGILGHLDVSSMQDPAAEPSDGLEAKSPETGDIRARET